MDKSILFNKHFEKFINNDVAVRHYFNKGVVDLKREHPTIFTSMKRSTGIRLINTDPETIQRAKEILFDIYLLKDSQGQGRTLSNEFKVLKDDKLVEIMKDRNLTFNERCEKVNNIIKGVGTDSSKLTYKQIEQYIYRNYSDYKPIPKVKPIPKSEVEDPGKFKEFKTDEVVSILNNNNLSNAQVFKMLHSSFKDKYTETQVRNYVARYRAKN